jgi:hypothetical protein
MAAGAVRGRYSARSTENSKESPADPMAASKVLQPQRVTSNCFVHAPGPAEKVNLLPGWRY